MSKEFVFVPLGGVGEIGMNLALYGYGRERDRQWIMVDCGVTFADDKSPGIDLIMPDIRFIEEDRKNLLGLIITHGHEDHIGAVLDLWPRLKCKIYATKFTAGLIKAKAAEDGYEVPPIQIVSHKGDQIKLGPFDVSFLPVAHSIPESQSLGIVTPAGRVIHTGDWKIDPTPPLGDKTDFDAFREFSKEGVDVLIGDSTNAVREGRSPSEAEVERELEKIIRNAKNRVAVTLFASNITRVDSIARAAQAAGRSVLIAGRALHRNITVAQECGYLKDLPPFLDQDSFSQIARGNLVLLMTGSQGEERSALARAAQGQHPSVKLMKGDLVIFSSRTIPGNEKAVGRILNGLVHQGVDVITDRTHLVHVSGHPRVEELQEMYRVVKPKALIPVHGESQHLKAHVDVARTVGVEKSLIIDDGYLVRLAPGDPTIIDEVPSGRLFKDGLILLDEEDTTLPERRRMIWGGQINIAFAITGKGEIVSDFDISLLGVPKTGISGEDMELIVADTASEVFRSIPKPRRKDQKMLREAITKGVRSTVEQEWGKKPNVWVHVLEV